MNTCKRKFPRIAIDFPVKYEVIKWNKSPHHPGNPMVAVCHDLSARGMRLRHGLDLEDKILKKLRDGTMRLNVEFTLPDDEQPINLLGRVIYCGEDEEEEEEIDDEIQTGERCMGIVFIEIDPVDYLKIGDFIQARTF